MQQRPKSRDLRSKNRDKEKVRKAKTALSESTKDSARHYANVFPFLILNGSENIQTETAVTLLLFVYMY